MNNLFSEFDEPSNFFAPLKEQEFEDFENNPFKVIFSPLLLICSNSLWFVKVWMTLSLGHLQQWSVFRETWANCLHSQKGQLLRARSWRQCMWVFVWALEQQSNFRRRSQKWKGYFNFFSYGWARSRCSNWK